jgi:hypothetical protein
MIRRIARMLAEPGKVLAYLGAAAEAYKKAPFPKAGVTAHDLLACDIYLTSMHKQPFRSF